jgi:hypothetical protein
MEPDNVRALLNAAMEEPVLLDVGQALEQIGWTASKCGEAVRRAAMGHTYQPFQNIAQEAQQTGIQPPPGVIERLCLLHAVAPALDRLSSTPLVPSVRQFLLREFQLIAQPDAATTRFLEARSSAVLTLAKLASLTRLPAGCFHCEVAAIPRSYLLRCPPRDWLPLWYMVALRVRGFYPCFETHMNPRIRLLRKEDGFKAYHRIARQMELQPDTKAMVAFSWLRSPENQRVSPHLRWMNEVIVQ